MFSIVMQSIYFFLQLTSSLSDKFDARFQMLTDLQTVVQNIYPGTLLFSDVTECCSVGGLTPSASFGTDVSQFTLHI